MRQLKQLKQPVRDAQALQCIFFLCYVRAVCTFIFMHTIWWVGFLILEAGIFYSGRTAPERSAPGQTRARLVCVVCVSVLCVRHRNYNVSTKGHIHTTQRVTNTHSTCIQHTQHMARHTSVLRPMFCTGAHCRPHQAQYK